MKLNIRLKLLVGFTLLLILSSLVQGFSFLLTKQYISSQISNFQEVQAKKGASEIQKFFTNLSVESFGVARVYQKDPKDIAPAANYVIKNNDYIKKISILSTLGRELIKFDTFGQVDKEQLSYEVFSEPFKSAVAGNTAISKVYYIESGLGPHLDLFSPIFADNGNVEGVVKMRINLNQVRNQLADIKLGGNGYIYVVDNEGRLLAHPSEAFVLERPNLSSRNVVKNALNNTDNSSKEEQYVNEQKVSVVARAVNLPGYNWIVVFEQPVAEAYGFLEFIRIIFIVTLIGSSIFLLLISLILSENLARPIRKLQQSAQLVEKGQLEKMIYVKSGDEIESLSASFASLVDQLTAREHSLEEASRQLVDVNKKLKVLDKLKDEFVSVASHELRTPMTAIRSYLWMALEGKGGVLTDKQKFYIERAYTSVDRLIKLVNDMLNISRIESGRLTVDMKALALDKLVQEVIEEIMPRVNELGIHLKMDIASPPPLVIADHDKIKEVLYNLIGNSLKFTPKDGEITISFSQDGDMVHTTVKDTGAGIDPVDLPKLFQKFGLLPGSYTTNKNASGTGLGLFISRSIVELLGGKVWVTSGGRGKGSEFSFSLKTFNEEELKKMSVKNANESKDAVGIIHTQV